MFFGRPRKYCIPICLEKIASWNVEGLRGEASTKLFELRHFMNTNGISILCLQETHLHGVHYYTEDGFTLFLFGIAEGSGRSYAGVGFLVAPWAIKSIISFRGINDRLASLRVKQSGGILTLLSAYAPHNGHTIEDRQLFFASLSENTRIRNKHSSTFVCGDLNAQLGQLCVGEEASIGPYVYQKSICKRVGRHPTENYYWSIALNTVFVLLTHFSTTQMICWCLTLIWLLHH